MNMTDDIDISDIMDAGHEEDSTAEDLDLESGDEADDAPGADEADENLNDENDEDSDEDDSDDNDDDEDSDEDDPKDEKAAHRNPGVEKRIAKEVAKRKAREETLKVMEAENQTLRDQLAEAQGSGKTYGSITEVTEAKRKLRRELDEIDDAIDEGGFERADGTTVDVKTLKAWRRQIRDELEDALPAAERRLVRQEEVNREQVSRLYPELLNPKSDLAKEAQRLFARVPSLRGDPEAYLLVGDLLRGRALRMKIAKNGKKAKGKVNPPESRTASAARSVRNSKPRRDDIFAEISAALPEYD
jgi:hypothetical protein